MARNAPTTHMLRHKDDTAYWVERRVGFKGIEWNYGAGWRTSRIESFRLAKQEDALNVVGDSWPLTRKQFDAWDSANATVPDA